MTTSHDDPRRDILRAWTDRLYTEYDNVCYHFGVKLPTPLIRIERLSGVWGQWSPLTRTICLSRALIEAYPWDVVLEVLKHEMAHQLVSERLGGAGAAMHGPVFRQACQMLGVADWAATASGELPQDIPSWRDRSMTDEEERLLKRAEKLLALAESSNEHEAALAMQRVRQLYAKYNLERLASRREAQHVYCLINRKQKRVPAEDSMIFSILTEHFFVRSIYTSLYDAQDLCDYKAVELLGTRENVLMAEYVFYFLRQKLAALWNDYRKRAATTGRSRRSYMLGVLAGFRDKLAATPPTELGEAPAEARPQATIQALLKLADRDLDEFIGKRHPRLSSRRFGTSYGDRGSYAAGRADGGAITLHKGITHRESNRGLRLPGGK